MKLINIKNITTGKMSRVKSNIATKKVDDGTHVYISNSEYGKPKKTSSVKKLIDEKPIDGEPRIKGAKNIRSANRKKS